MSVETCCVCGRRDSTSRMKLVGHSRWAHFWHPETRHGDLPAPSVDQILEPDPEVYLAGGPLAPDDCACDGLCECEENTDA